MLDIGRSSLKRRQKTETELREGRIRTSQLPLHKGAFKPEGLHQPWQTVYLYPIGNGSPGDSGEPFLYHSGIENRCQNCVIIVCRVAVPVYAGQV